MRRLVAVVLPILFLTVALSGFLLFRGAGAEVYVVRGEGEVRLYENGGASLELSTTTEGPLFSLYHELQHRVGGENFRKMLGEGALEEYEALSGMEAVPSLFEVEWSGENRVRISTEASVLRASRFNPSENLWEMEMGLRRGKRDGVSFILGQMMFMQLMLSSMPEKDQKMERVTTLPIKLPEGAILANGGELSGKKWRVDFGGGNYRETRLDLQGSELRLTERVVVTEKPPREITPDLLLSLQEYRSFTVKYSLPGTESLPQAEEEGGEESDFCWEEGARFSFPLNLPFRFSSGGVSAEAGVTGSVGLGLSWVVEWDFEEGKLQVFRAYAEVDPSLSLALDWNIQGELSHDWSKEIYEWNYPVFCLLFNVPVVVNLKATVSGGLEVGTRGDFSLRASMTSSTTFKLGVQWTKEGGWGPVAEVKPSFSRSGPCMEGMAYAQPYLDFEMGAYFYNTAGPYLSLKPLLELETSNLENWSLKAGFDVEGGVCLGMLTEWLDVGDWSTTLCRWRTPLATGSGEGIPPSGPNTPPHLHQRTGPPPSVGLDTTVVYEVVYSDEEGDPPKYVRCVIDNRPLEMKWVGGNYKTGALYRYEWTTTSLDLGPHTYYFEASDWRETVRWPEKGLVSSPTVLAETSLPPRWVYRIPGVIKEVKVAEEGPHFVVVADEGSAGHSLYFFSRDENRPLWTKDRIGSAAISPEGSLVLASGLPGSNPRLFLLDSSGREVWSYDVGYYPCPVGLSRRGETAAAVGVSEGEATLYLFSGDGRLLWTRKLGSMGSSAPLLSLSRNGQYVAVFLQNEERRTIFLFSRDSSSPLWTYELEGLDTVFSLDSSGDGTYLAAGCHSGIRLFSRLENVPLWSYRTVGQVRDVSVVGGYYLAAGEMYEIAAERRFEGKIYLFTTEKGTPEWVRTTGPIACISLYGGGLAAGDMDGRLYFFDERGNPLWGYTVSFLTYPDSVGVFSNWRVVVGDTAGGVYFFEP
ncbi:MAG: hypothetical protein QW098_05760 [Candidatus Hadarchaeales archaeon]